MSASKPDTNIAVVLAPAARLDIRKILRWSEEKFGRAAALRYQALLTQALRDLAAQPDRPGTALRADLGWNARTYHLSFSKFRMPEPTVKTPRHILLYRITNATTIEIARILHDSRDLYRHVPPNFKTPQALE